MSLYIIWTLLNLQAYIAIYYCLIVAYNLKKNHLQRTLYKLFCLRFLNEIKVPTLHFSSHIFKSMLRLFCVLFVASNIPICQKQNSFFHDVLSHVESKFCIQVNQIHFIRSAYIEFTPKTLSL